ncbi:MAG: molecular chaperone Hsp33, partial [Pseudomonadota bacterium]|nr:molecular chaperone Hsp33 [Pseudomonadota bacterium]
MTIHGGELHKFIFEGLPVRGVLVRLTGAWTEMLARRQGAGGYPAQVQQLLGEMSAAATLMQANIKFNGALVLQIQGDGPVKLAVAEAQPDLTVRATAKVVGDVPAEASLKSMLDAHRQGRCVITLDPKDRQPGQQPYQGVVPLHGEHGEPMQQLSEVLEHYMLQSEQLETRLILAADDQVAAGLLIQRLPLEGAGNLEVRSEDEEARLHEGYNRIAHLAATLKREELLSLDTPTILRRLFWEEDLRLFEPQTPRFGCTCSRERVARMLVGLGREEVESVIAERGEIEV